MNKIFFLVRLKLVNMQEKNSKSFETIISKIEEPKNPFNSYYKEV